MNVSTRIRASLIPLTPRRFGLGLLLAAPALLLAAGCSGGGSQMTKNVVSGKVTLKDQPVAGTVHFVYSDNKEASAPTGPDGSYSIPNLKTGSVKILVKAMPGASDTKLVAPPVGGDKGAPTVEMPGTNPVGTGVRPPPKYSDANTSPLTYDIKEGKQTHDIELTP